jgi:hypothetical protein
MIMVGWKTPAGPGQNAADMHGSYKSAIFVSSNERNSNLKIKVMNNDKDNKNQSNKIVNIKFDPSYAMGPLVDQGVVTVKDRAGNKIRVLCIDAGLSGKQEVVGIHPKIGVTTYNIKGEYESDESEYDLHLEYKLGLAKEKFGYDVLAAIGFANGVFGDPDQYSPMEQKMIMEMCVMLMS